MKPTLNDKIIAYLALVSGLAISGVAEYYSIMGLIAIYPAAFWPVIILGIVLGVGKISATVWLKQNWEWSPFFLKAYVLPAIIILMMITSLGVFGFLSKAHSDQSLVSGDVQSKIAIYDEKIKTAKENIEADRRQLRQMDEAVDQVMARSTTEEGATKSNAIRRAQARDRATLAKSIEANQKLIGVLNDEAAPIRAEVRKVEAEVGPIKYIAHLLYGENPDTNILEKAVIWVTVLIVIVLDPLAIVLLLSSQYSFQRFREVEKDELTPDPYVADVGEKPTEEEKKSFNDFAPHPQDATEGDSPEKESDVVSTATVTQLAEENYIEWTDRDFEELAEDTLTSIDNESATTSTVTTSTVVIPDTTSTQVETVKAPTPIKNISQLRPQVKVFRPPLPDEITEEVVQQKLEEPTLPKTEERTYSSSNYVTVNGQTYRQGAIPTKVEQSPDATYVQNEEQTQSNLWSATTGNTREFFETEKPKKE